MPGRSLEIVQDPNQNLMLLQRKWIGILNPLLRAPQSGAVILKSVVLAVGSNSVPHTLNAPLTGWIVVRQRSAANIYDNQDANPSPTQTLVLISDAAVTVDLMVF